MSGKSSKVNSAQAQPTDAAPRWMTINEICAASGLSHCWVRRLATQGKFPAAAMQMVHRVSPIDGAELLTEVRIINVSNPVVAARLNGEGSHNKREDGRSRLIAHATSAELEAAKKLLEANGIKIEFTRNVQKRKPRATPQ